MYVKLTYKEFKQIQAFVKNSKNTDIINHFNDIFNMESNSIVKGVHNPIHNEFEIDFPEKAMVEIFGVIAENASDLGTMIKFDLNMRSVPKWLSVGSAILDQIKTSLKIK